MFRQCWHVFLFAAPLVVANAVEANLIMCWWLSFLSGGVNFECLDGPVRDPSALSQTGEGRAVPGGAR